MQLLYLLIKFSLQIFRQKNKVVMVNINGLQNIEMRNEINIDIIIKNKVSLVNFGLNKRH